MVLHTQFAGLASLRSSPLPPRPSSKHGREFLPRPTLLFSSSSFCRLPPKTLIRSPSFHFCSATDRLSISAAVAPDPDYPKPSYEKSIFLHIVDKYYPAKKPLKPTVDPENPESCHSDSVDVLSSREDSAKEDSGETARECKEWGDGGGKKEEEEEKQELSPDQCASSRIRTAQVEFGETALGCDQLGDDQLGDGGEKGEDNYEFSSEKLDRWRNAYPSAERSFVNEGFPADDILMEQITSAGGEFFDTRGSEEDFAGQEVIDEEREEESVGLYTSTESTLGRGSNAEDRSDTGFKESGQGTESGFMVRPVNEDGGEVEDAGSSHRFGGERTHVEEDDARPSQIRAHNSEVWEYEFGDSEAEEFTSAADELDLSASTRGNGPSELGSSGEEQDVEEPSEVRFSNPGWNFDAVDPQTDQYSGRRQGLKVGRQVFLTGEQHYKRWMPNSGAEDHVQGSLKESPGEEELPHSISKIGESAVTFGAEDGDDETSGEKEDTEIDPKEEEGHLSSNTADTSGGETRKDLLVEFLKKRSEHWGDSTRPFVKDTSTSLKIPFPEQTDGTLSTEEKLLFTSAEVMTTQDQLPESPVPKGLIQEVLSIAKSLPPNASLETFLTPFCGQISTNEGNLVLKCLGENHFTWPMLSFFQWMRLHSPCLLDSRSFCTLFTYMGKLRMADQALLQYENMSDDGAFHCVQVYNSLLGALARAGRPEKIPIILQEMEKRNVERDAVTYSILITATKGGKERYDRVWSLFDDLLRDGVKPSVSVYGSLIKAFCDEGHLKQAVLASLAMEKVGISPNVIIYNTLIDAYARASQLEEAEGLLVEMKQRGLHPMESTYNALINGYGRSGQLDVAEELVLEMQKKGLKPNVATYTSLISAYGKHLSSEKAVNVFLKMKKSGLIPNSQTYTALINAYAEGGWHEKAQRAFDNMLREGVKPTVETYTALLDGYRRAGHLDMVRHVWNTIKEDGCELSRITYRTTMDAFAKHGFYVEARDVMDEFRKRGLEPDTIIFNMLLNAYARGGVCTKLRKVFSEMQAAGCEPDSFTYCTLIYSFIRHRDFSSAFKYDKEMLEKGLKPSPNIYGKMRFILDSKYAEKLENDKKANAGQDPVGLQNTKSKNPQRKKTNFKRYQKRGPRRGSERTKALWKEKEKQGMRQGS